MLLRKFAITALISIFSSLSFVVCAVEPIPKQGFPFEDYNCWAIAKEGPSLNVVVENVDSDSESEVIVADWEGYIYALNSDGTTVENWPFHRISHFEGFYPFCPRAYSEIM